MGKLTHTIKGPIASFRSADVAPIESLKLHFLPKQEGSGDASPQNIRNITGWTGCNLFGSGMNLWDEEWELGTFNNNTGEKNPPSNYGIRSKNYIPCKPSTTYYLRHPIQSNDCHLYFYGKNKEYIDHIWKWSVSFTTPSNCYYIRFYMHSSYGTTYLNNIGINYPPKSSYVASVGNKSMEISWSDHGVEYGGYIDPVRGKLIAEYEFLTDTWGDWGTAQDQGDGTVLRVKKFVNPVYGNSLNNHHTDYCNVAKYKYANEDGTTHYYIVGNSYNCRVYLPTDFSTDQVIQVIGKLITPIEYDLTPTDLQTFLDYNNFWSDMNDDTEVEYAFADRLSERKALMIPYRRIINWNQIQLDGDFPDLDNYVTNNDYGSISASGNVMTWTCTKQPTQFYHTGFQIRNGTGNSNFLNIPYNHKVLVSALVRCSVSTRVRLYGLVSTTGNTYIYSYSYENKNIPANEWVKIIGFISDRPETPPASATDVIIKRFKPTLMGYNSTISTIEVGTTLEVKKFMAFDLTQMFGLGNEPSTVEEFERICRINGVDLDTYQPYDTGSQRLWIIP